MSHLDFFKKYGLEVYTDNEVDLKIKGISSLPGKKKDLVIQYARDHKPGVLAELLTPKVSIRKMPNCLHNLPCHFITVKDFRQICGRNKQPVFELDHCPINKWWWAKNQPITGDKEHE
jgi:hypothetical protein